MREILFRGKGYGGWSEGSLLQLQDAVTIQQTDGEDFVVDPETVGQYTGFKDKDGDKIFEEDIVWLDGATCYSYVHMVNGCWWVLSKEMDFLLYHCPVSSMKVVGNLHDNLNLLDQME